MFKVEMIDACHYLKIESISCCAGQNNVVDVDCYDKCQLYLCIHKHFRPRHCNRTVDYSGHYQRINALLINTADCLRMKRDEVDVPLASDLISMTNKFLMRSCCHWAPVSPLSSQTWNKYGLREALLYACGRVRIHAWRGHEVRQSLQVITDNNARC